MLSPAVLLVACISCLPVIENSLQPSLMSQSVGGENAWMANIEAAHSAAQVPHAGTREQSEAQVRATSRTERSNRIDQNYVAQSTLIHLHPKEEQELAQADLDHHYRLSHAELKHQTLLASIETQMDASSQNSNRDAFHSRYIQMAHTARFNEEKASHDHLMTLPPPPFTAKVRQDPPPSI